MLCENCYHKRGCLRQLQKDGRCSFYVKNGQVDIDDDIGVNPMDTITFDYDDIKKLFKDISLEDIK